MLQCEPFGNNNNGDESSLKLGCICVRAVVHNLKWKLWNSVCTRRCLMYATMFLKIFKGLVHISLSYRMPALDAISRTNCKNVECPV